ncbi:hypothetical protein BJ878DRAFT_488499 [Calycina marina]|uniref:Uncharacterized protein n=1 Tax=Calycina marina TaxID=1763456 RepID=A0A9P7ZAB0_9HELO|nr:hypothetical protein BJ878DRAFT_488499 [Calycina marina]
MRSQYFILIFVLPISAIQIQIPSIFAGFLDPQSANGTAMDGSHDLYKRDGNCPVDSNSCTTLGEDFGGACCTVGSVCTTDSGHGIACCPIGAKCTGTATRGSATATGSGGAVLGSVTTPTPVSALTTSGSAPTTTMTDPDATITGAVSYLSNAYFPFPIIPTSYANSAACNSAYEACQTNYAACTADLGGSAFGVTVVAPDGAGITQAPSVVAVGASSASSICSSLSAQACYDISSDTCDIFGGGTFSNGDTTAAAAKPRQSMGCLAAGMMALGVVGHVV